MGAVELEPQMSDVNDGCGLEHHEFDQDRAIGEESSCCDPTLSFHVHAKLLNSAGDSQNEFQIIDQMVNDRITQARRLVVDPDRLLFTDVLQFKWTSNRLVGNLASR
jgi:hypothetical protein